jgi:predicted RNase H-like nuclease
MLMQFARLKSSQPIEGFGSSLIDRPTLARHYQCVSMRESHVSPIIPKLAMALVAGVDGCPGGWLCVTEDTDLGFRTATIYPSADELLAGQPKSAVLAVDMPIGLPETGVRSCGSQAKDLLGGSHMCIFPAPTRRAHLAPSRIAAARILGRGVTCFEWELYSKIKNLDRYLKPEHQSWVFEVHPEVCFSLLNQNSALRDAKKTPQGMRAREQLLDSKLAGLRSAVRESLDRADFTRALYALDDINDALAALWSAHRILAKQATPIPAAVEKDGRGLRMAIWA